MKNSNKTFDRYTANGSIPKEQTQPAFTCSSRHLRRSGVFVVNIEHIFIHLALVFLKTLNMQLPAGKQQKQQQTQRKKTN